MTRLSRLLLLPFLPVLIACGGSGSGGAAEAPPVATPDTVMDPDFSQVRAEFDRFEVANATLIIGDATGEMFRAEKGTIRADTQVNIASASKLYTGLAVWSLVATGALSTASAPQDHIDFWTDDPTDNRSRVTLDHLMSFRSGFNSPPRLDSCPGDTGLTLESCIRSLFEDGVETEPGTHFAYGPDHMQIAALMVRGRTGRELSDIMNENIWSPAGAGPATTFPNAADNVRYSGGIRSTAEDYGRVLTALLSGDLIARQDLFLQDRTAGAQIARNIPAVEDLNADWHYGFGFWVECDRVPFSSDCAQDPTISSPGAFGFTPWVDFQAGYWAVLSMQEPLQSDPSPSVRAVQFEQTLQPLIVDALNGG